MKEREYLKKLKKLVKNYVSCRVIEERRTKPHLDVMLSFALMLHEDDTENISKGIYELRNNSNIAPVFNLLENYTKLMLKDLDEMDYDELINLKFSEVTTKKVSKMTGIANTLRVFMLMNLNIPEREGYPEIYKCQDEILEEYKKLANELDINTGLDLSHYYTYLLWNGYFSPTKKHSYQLRDRIVSHPTFEVFQGKGVCLNYAELLKDFQIKCGKEAKVANCLATRENLQPDPARKEKNEIKRDVDITQKEQFKSSVILLAASPLVKEFGNHAITLIGDGEKTFYYDPTNLFTLNPAGNKKAVIINGKGSLDIKLELTLNSHSKHKLEQLKDYLADLALENHVKEVFTKEEVNETYDAVISKMKENSGLLEDAYNEIKPHILKINEEIDKNIEDLKVSYTKKKKEKKH